MLSRLASLWKNIAHRILKEQIREVKAGAFLDTLLLHIRYGMRMLRKYPSFALAAIVTLGLGIGANTAIFTLIGVPSALALMRLTCTFLFGLTPADPVTLTAAIVVLTAVAVLAAYIPARRASRVEPMVALRVE